MDAQALKATLIQLGDSLPAMGAQVGEAVDTAHAAAAAGEELAQRSVALAEHADAEAAAAQQAVEEYGDFAEESRGHLAQASAQLEAHAQELGELDAPLAALDATVGHGEEALGRLQTSLAAGSAALEDAATATHGQVEALLGAVVDGHQKLAAGVEATTTVLKSLQDTVDQGHAAVVEASDQLVHQVTAHQDTLVEKVGGFLGDGNQAMGALSGDLTQTLPLLMQDPVSAALGEVQSKVHDEIQQLVKSAMDHVLASLDDFEKKLEDAQQGSSLSRELLKPLFDQVDELVKPLVGSLDSIKDAAAMVGIPL